MCSKVVPTAFDYNLEESEMIQGCSDLYLSNDFKRAVRQFEEVPENASSATYLAKFYQLLSGAYFFPDRLIYMFTAMPDYAEKLDKFMKFYKFARVLTYDDLKFENKLSTVLSHHLPQNNRVEFVNSWYELVNVSLIIFVDRVASCCDELIEAGHRCFQDIENMMKEIAMNINDIYHPEGIRVLMKDVKSLTPLINDLRTGKMNHFERIVLKYSFNELLYKLYIHITFKTLTMANSIMISNFVRLAYNAGLITGVEGKRFEAYIDFTHDFCYGMDLRRKYKVVPLLLGYSNGLTFNNIYKIIYW